MLSGAPMAGNDAGARAGSTKTYSGHLFKSWNDYDMKVANLLAYIGILLDSIEEKKINSTLTAFTHKILV